MKRIAHLADAGPIVRPGCRVLLHSACASPPRLARELAELAGEGAAPIEVFDVVTVGRPRFVDGLEAGRFRLTTQVPGRAVRHGLRSGAVTLLREPMSRGPGLVGAGAIGADLLLLHISPPDAQGCMSLGVSCDIMRAALARRPVVVAEVNPRMPRTCGDTRLRPEDVGFWLESDGAPVEVPPSSGDATDQRIADHIAGLVEDGDVIQTGIGSIPDLTLARLLHRRRLGVHTGIVTEAVQALIERGVVQEPAVTTMAAGSASFYRFLDGNEAVRFLPCDRTHGAAALAGVRRLCAVNGALEIDLVGRVNAEAVGGQTVSGPGGQPDFARGATDAPGGKSIIALRATSKDGGTSRILPALAPGSPVTIDTSWVDFVVTEHGVARVRGRGGGALAAALAGIAAPEFRAGLRQHSC